MSATEDENGMDRAELLQRVELMEQMVAEGRSAVERKGWIFVAWGICFVVVMLWSRNGLHGNLAWAVCMVVTTLIVGTFHSRQKEKQRATGVRSLRSRTLEGVWTAFNAGFTFFVAAAVLAHQANSALFLAAVCFLLGTVNMTSAAILRWEMQGVAGAIWWAAGIACFFLDGNGQRIAFLTAAILAHICFGLYMTVMERRRDARMAAAPPKMPVVLPEMNPVIDTVPKEEMTSTAEDESGIQPTELLQRVELMEQMIAEGRQATGRFGWLFVLFGAGYFVGIGWEWISRRHSQGGGRFGWQELVLLVVVLPMAAVIANKIKRRQQRLYGGSKNRRSRAFGSVWLAMGCSLTLYNVGSLMSHHVGMPTFVATTLIIFGMANATSAMLLRWKAQGVLAALCWAGGFAMFFVAPKYGGICYAAVYAGMIVFGLYAMTQEHRRDHVSGDSVRHNA